MDFTPPGLLLVKSKNLNLERYIFCQKINDSRRSNELTSTDNGRRNLILEILKHIAIQGARERVIEQMKKKISLFC